MKNIHHLLVAAFVGGGLAFALPGVAQDSKSNLPRADVKFLQKAAQDGLAEVHLGQLAQDKAMREEVRQLATRMVQDHGKANEQLKSIAASHGVQVASTLDRHHEREMNRLSELIGGDFARAYMSRMLDDHRKDVSQFRKRAKAKKQNDVTQFA